MGGLHWTSADLERLKDIYPVASKAEVLAAFPTRTWTSLRVKANHLGLYRTGAVSFRRRNPLRRSLTDWELAYIAAIIDGEGHITFLRSNRPTCVLYTPTVGVTNQSEALIHWMDERIHWTIRSLRPDTSGLTWVYRPSVVGHGSAILLRALLPYLVIKRYQAELVIQFCDMRASVPAISPVTAEQVEIAERARSLNRRRPEPTSRLLLSRQSA